MVLMRSITRRRMKLTLSFLLLLAWALIPGEAQAQFVAYVGLQTTQQIALNAVAISGPSANLRNVGQSGHILRYETTCTNPATDLVRIRIEGSFDGTTFFAISNTATDTTSGTVFASGYFPVVRINLLNFTCVGGASLTARYSGIATEPGNEQGDAAASMSASRGLTGGDLGVNRITTIAAFDGHSGGTVFIDFSAVAGCTTGSARLRVEGQTPVAGFSSGGILLGSIPLIPSQLLVARITTLTLPAVPINNLTFTFENINLNAPVGCSVLAVYLSDRKSDVRESLTWYFTDRTTTGIFEASPTGGGVAGLPVSLIHPTHHSVSLRVGTNTTCTFNLEGSNDGITWLDLSGPIDCTTSTNFTVANRLVNFIRGNLTALTGAGSQRVSFTYTGTAN